ncbi:toxin-antitoxin system YwqK family antitoxin [Maribacter sp. 2308TA10-17]|uniref:toxin-antitoxin system YwqK family antitoxin n=1 Tax=Maribacter sp. 2308TA10-17 TaxID=3386276 RepID=UPI0039BC96BF
MKATTLFLLFFTVFGFTQEIKYTLFLKDSCSNKIENALLYHLQKNGTEYRVTDINGTVILPEKGEYELVATEIEEIHSIIIDKLVNSDTLTQPTIEEYIKRTNVSLKKGVSKEELKRLGIIPNYKFISCEKTCDGIETDYYSNGATRLIAEFKNGLVIGELKRYYQNGIIKEVSVYDENGFLTKTTLFEKNGEIKSEQKFNGL